MNVQRDAQKLLERQETDHEAKRKHHQMDSVEDRSSNCLVSLVATKNKASALSVFRRQYIVAKQHAGVRRDWMTGEAWTEVKDAFSGLSAEQQNQYKQLAFTLNCRRFLSKEGKSHRMVEGAQFGNLQVQEVKPVALRTPPSSFNMLFSTDSNFDFATASVTDLAAQLGNQIAKVGSSKQLDQLPVTEENVLSSLISLRCRGLRLGDAVKHLSRTCGFLAGAKSDKDEFPKNVLYHRHCQGVCCNTYEFKFLKLQTAIVNELHALARKYKKPSDLVQQDLLLVFDIFIDDDVFSEFYLVTAAAFRGGVQQPVESYTKLEIDKRGGDIFLHLVPSPPVLSKQSWPQPIDRGFQFGTIRSLSTVQLAAHIALLDSEVQGIMAPVGMSRYLGARHPQKVVIRECEYYDVSRTILRLKGPAEESQPITLTADTIASMEESARGKQTKPTGSSTRTGSKVDMLGIFDEVPSTRAGSSKTTRGDAATGGNVDTTTATDIPPNPYAAFEDDLAEQMMEALDLPRDLPECDDWSKWEKHFSGLLDPDQVDALRQAPAHVRYLSFVYNSILLVIYYIVSIYLNSYSSLQV